MTSNRTCSLDGCNLPYRCSGYCGMHYNRVRVNGDPGPIGRILEPANQICSEDECEKKAKSKGLCHQHHYRKNAEEEAASNTHRRTPKWFTMDQKLRRIGWDEVVARPDLGPCWVWRGDKDKRGYGRIADKDRQMRFAHRIAHREWLGSLDPDLQVLHHCDNPPCINPDHLRQGDQADNMGDARSRDRTAYGERQGRHKLTEDQVEEIREKYVPRVYTQKMLATEYGVTQTAIGLIIRGRNWRRAGGEVRKNSSVKMTPDRVREVRRMTRSGVGVKDIAGKYGVCTQTVVNILSGKFHKHVK